MSSLRQRSPQQLFLEALTESAPIGEFKRLLNDPLVCSIPGTSEGKDANIGQSPEKQHRLWINDGHAFRMYLGTSRRLPSADRLALLEAFDAAASIQALKVASGKTQGARFAAEIEEIKFGNLTIARPR